MNLPLQIDTLATASQEMVTDQPVEKTLSIWELLTTGGIGGNIIMITLGLMLFLALYLYFERLLAINAASKIDSTFMDQIKDNIINGKIEAAKLLCAQSKSPVARLTEKGISRIGKPLEYINTAI